MESNFVPFEKKQLLQQKHDKHTFTYAISKLFERGGYYGLRAILILYMVGETLNMSDIEAISVYGLFASTIIISQIIGGVLGDLFLGNKNSVILGGILQALGAFFLCIPATSVLYIGMFFIVIGGGLYTPNILSLYGKSYLTKPKLLDSAFSILYIATNIGAFISALLVGYIAYEFSFQKGFATAGIFFMLSVILPLFLKEKKLLKLTHPTVAMNKRVTVILIICMLSGTFWGIYETIGFAIFDIKSKIIEVSTLKIPNGIWDGLDTILVFSLSFIAAIVWTFTYYNQFIKLTIGFLFATTAICILFYIPELPSENHSIYYLTAIFFLAIAEIHINPIIRSLLTLYTNPKYLAILMSVLFLPYKIVYALIMLVFNDTLNDNASLALKVSTLFLGAMSIGLIIFLRNSSKWFLKR